MSYEKIHIDWDEGPLQRWLGTIARDSTKYIYKGVFKVYYAYTRMTATQMIEEAIEDSKRSPLEKKDIVINRLIEFYKYLSTEYSVDVRGPPRKGLSGKSAHTYVSAIRSFYATFGFAVRMKGRTALPRPQVKNKRMRLNAEQVKMLVDTARNPRDRAIILMMFQSGMDVSTLCSMTYGQVAEGIKNNENPLKLELFRKKRGTEYYSFVSKDAINALKIYIKDMENRGVVLKNNSPLFLKERGKEILTDNLVQNMMREVAFKAGFIDENLNGNAVNPVSPHALRESFGSIMINSSIPDTIVDFWLGHELGDMARAYKGAQFESLKKMYSEREHLFSISQSQNMDKLKEEVTEEVKKEARDWYGNVLEDNVKLRQELDGVLKKISELELRQERYEDFTRKFMEMTPDELEALSKLIYEKNEKEIMEALEGE